MTHTRNAGLDLLRLILMFFIILGHLFTHTHIRQVLPILSHNGLWCWGWQTICLCAVNCFVLMTGYFMFQTRWKSSHLLKLWLRIWIYAVGIGVLLLLAGKAVPTLEVLLDMFLPLLRQVWWFMSIYVLLYLCIPFLNMGLRQLTHPQFTCFVTGIVLVFYILPLFAFFFPSYDPTNGMGIIGFVTLYIVGAYIASQPNVVSYKWCIGGLVINNLCIFGSKVLLEYVAAYYHLTVGSGLFYHYNTVWELVNAVLLLLLFKQIALPCGKKLITWGASSVFAVYLLHEHPLIRHILWQSGLLSLLQNASFIQFALLSFCFPLLILCVGIIIDKFVYLLLLSPLLNSVLWHKIQSYCQQVDVLLLRGGE